MMGEKYRYEALNNLSAELNRTAVLSEDFKKEIISHAFALCGQAYEEGVRNTITEALGDGRELTERERSWLKRHEEG